MVPTLERAVTKSYSFLSKPILWVYRRTIGAAVHKIVRRVNRSLDTGNEEPVSKQLASPETVNQSIERIGAFTKAASEITGNLGRRLRFFAMLPMYVLYCVTLAIGTIPVVVAVYFLGG